MMGIDLTTAGYWNDPSRTQPRERNEKEGMT
jgi:hypothetical protein